MWAAVSSAAQPKVPSARCFAICSGLMPSTFAITSSVCSPTVGAMVGTGGRWPFTKTGSGSCSQPTA